MFLASPITFPNLGITVDPSPVAFTAFGKDIYWYGIIISAGRSVYAAPRKGLRRHAG